MGTGWIRKGGPDVDAFRVAIGLARMGWREDKAGRKRMIRAQARDFSVRTYESTDGHDER